MMNERLHCEAQAIATPDSAQLRQDLAGEHLDELLLVGVHVMQDDLVEAKREVLHEPLGMLGWTRRNTQHGFHVLRPHMLACLIKFTRGAQFRQQLVRESNGTPLVVCAASGLLMRRTVREAYFEKEGLSFAASSSEGLDH